MKAGVSARLVCQWALVLVFASSVSARWASLNQSVPLERLVKNISAHLEEHPDDADAWYALGRAHSLAFSRRWRFVPVWSSVGPLPRVVGDDGIPVQSRRVDVWAGSNPERTEKTIEGEERVAHLEASIGCFERALRLAGDRNVKKTWAHMMHMSLGYVLEHGADLSADVGAVPGFDPQRSSTGTLLRSVRSLARAGEWEEIDALAARRGAVVVAALGEVELDAAVEGERDRITRRHWLREAAGHYAAACRLAKPVEMKDGWTLGGLEQLVCHEAAASYMRLAESGRVDLDDRDVNKVRKTLKEITEFDWQFAVTPIVFAMRQEDSLDELLDDAASVPFDLDGTGREQRWSWVTPRAAVLVWDPEKTGVVTSGRQLFGSVTWWMFFADGYAALGALDDDRDGELAGDELSGLVLWTDANTNGVADPGEVAPVHEKGIAGVAVSAVSEERGMLANPAGVRMTDGSTRASYDWIAHSKDD